MEGNLARKLEFYSDPLWEERVDGQTVMMAPASVNHHRISGNIYALFSRYLQGRPCEPFSDGVGLYLSEKERYIPDGMVVCDPEKVKGRGVTGAPDLVVEVLSRSTAKRDRGHKKDAYERYGVREYWIVNPADLSLEQYLLEDGKFILRDVYHKYTPDALEELDADERAAIVTEFPCGVFPDLTVRLEEVFGRVSIR